MEDSKKVMGDIPSPERPERPTFALVRRSSTDGIDFRVSDVVGTPDGELAGVASEKIDVSALTDDERKLIRVYANEIADKGFDALNLYFLVEARVNELLRSKESPEAFTIREHERRRLKEFFGSDVEVPPLPKGVTFEKILHWEKLKFELRYLPAIDMSSNRDIPGWKHKPGKRYTPDQQFGIEFYDELQTIKYLPENNTNPNLKDLGPVDLPGCWMLVDTRKKPDLKNELQEYEDDRAIQGLLRVLARQGVVNQEAAKGLRNKIHPDVFRKPEFWNAFSALLKLEDIPGATVRLPRTIEANVMGQGKGFHDTDTYEWCEEYFVPGKRIVSGQSHNGGASGVLSYGHAGGIVGFRPLVVFPRE